MVIVKMIQMKELRRLELLWREDIIIGTIGVWLENIRVRDQKQALICGTCEVCSLWLRPEMRMESKDIGKFNTRNMKLDELLINF